MPDRAPCSDALHLKPRPVKYRPFDLGRTSCQFLVSPAAATVPRPSSLSDSLPEKFRQDLASALTSDKVTGATSEDATSVCALGLTPIISCDA
ncbi:hypothetical protein BAUCODRAFT_333347 [Baudoinia panamericana UAMH 10762]|uniref:Uncharacterized protein n=1 Tax=Baudoinia panamericana (strain UAMH 10762) TaxID=717646 RepID=M2MXS0_BAUPA|nr:uncharacterized protein BAUCODRAFT_333347 [Baudoinia panamericana UAMH 10762]EMC91040.1 hypothetical protein BAUCODRAFT_333347 [Baudoinia panamericana UAMH 10762]